MEPVAAFSLACGIIQVVSFSKDLVHICKALYNQGSLTEHADILASAEHLKSLQSKLEGQRLIEEVSANPQPIDAELLELAQKCSQTAQKLIDEIGQLKAPRRRDVLKKVVKIRFRQRVLEKLQAQMETYRRTLDTSLIIDLRGRMASVLTEQTNAFQKLDRSMQDIVRYFAEEPVTCDQIARLLQKYTSPITEDINQTLQTQDLNRERRLYCDKFLASLHFPEIESRQEEVAEAHQETFQWIFDDSGGEMRPWANFVDWLKTESNTYWISGKAGSGKSTLMNYIRQDERTMKALKAWAGPKNIICPSFFFWAAGSKLQKSVAGLLRSLLYRIFEQFRDLIPGTTRSTEPVRSSVASVHEFEPIRAWTERRLSDTLQRTIRTVSSSCCVCLFIDGLDEFEGDHYELIETIQTISSLPAIKCCVSSRAESVYQKAFGSSSMLRLQDLTRSDIERFVSAKFKAIPEMRVFLDRRTWDPVDLIVGKADGVFLWVQLAVKSQIIGIRSHDDIETLWRRLEELPTEINHLYSCMLKRIPEVYRKEAAQYLRLAYLLTQNRSYSIASVWSIVLALHYTKDALYKKPDISRIVSECARAIQRINLTCAGLIYCHGHEEDIAGGTLDPSNLTAQFWLLRCGERYGENHGRRYERTGQLTYCHRTAREFFDPGQPGANFIDIRAQYESIEMVWASVCLAELVMVSFFITRPPWAQYTMKEAHESNGALLGLICKYLIRAESSDCNGKRKAIEFVHHVEKCINYVCDWCGRTREDFWQNVRESKYRGATGGTVTIDSSRATDFSSFAASRRVYFPLEDRLDREDQSLSHSEIQLLARCVVWTDLPNRRSTINNLRQLKIVTRLIQMGADANSSNAHTTIWEEALRYMFATRYEFPTRSTSSNPTVLADIIEIFLQNGADPYPVVHRARFEESRKSFEIDLKLSELPTYRRILERLITAGEVSQTTISASRLLLPQIRIQDIRSKSPVELVTFDCDLNDEIRPQIYALIDQVFNTQGELSSDFRKQIIRQIRAVLRMDEETMGLESLWGPLCDN